MGVFIHQLYCSDGFHLFVGYYHVYIDVAGTLAWSMQFVDCWCSIGGVGGGQNILTRHGATWFG